MDSCVKEIVNDMSLIDKARLLSGKNFWQSKEFEKYGIKSHVFTDGPHGLRKQSGSADHLGINLSDPATCFPTASMSACSFNKELLTKMGEAMGDKCIRENVSCILGPGANMKRSPLCGRNFEYFSEDPYLAGKMAASLIKGIESKGVGSSLKHFACNNQEYARMINDSNIDIRALRENYLTAFEIAVKEGKPSTVMCSYNKINGTYSSNNKWLLTDVLRDEWGYEGLVISDWGALDDPVKGVEAGCDFEMPYSGEDNAKCIVDAVNNKTLSMEDLDKCVTRMVEMLLRYQEEKVSTSNDEKDHDLARLIANDSAVLLKNDDDILPLKDDEEVLIIGNMAKNPRYQGAGSSKIVPIRIDNIVDSAIKENKKIEFVYGYKGLDIDEELIQEAREKAVHYSKVLIVCGLPDEYEGEGYDRKYFKIPESHLHLINEVSRVNKNIIVVLQGGSPFDLSFKDDVKGILLTYLSGEAGGYSTVDLLWGKVNPSGKLAETWPIKLEDVPSYKYYPGKVKVVEYRESIYMGYRYYNTVNLDVNYPFGYGLSYTTFKYDNLRINKLNDFEYEVLVDITNTGNVKGKEIVELYISKKDSKIFRSSEELKAFEKVELEPNETKTVKLLLNKDSFRYFNTAINSFAYEGGKYEICIGKSSRDILLTSEVEIIGDNKEELLQDKYSKLDSYNKPKIPFSADREEFEILLDHQTNKGELDKKGEFTINSCLEDLKSTFIGKIIINRINSSPESAMEENADIGMKNNAREMLMVMPLRNIAMSGKITRKQIKALVEVCNGHFFKAVKLLLSK